MNNITIEEKQFDFLSPELTRPVAFIRRFQQGGNRFYYTVEEDGNINLYSSATTLIKDGYAEDGYALEAWRNRLRAEGKSPEYELTYSATRGTLMHFLLGEYLQGKIIDLGSVNNHILEFAPELTTLSYYSEVINKDSLWLVKSILAFAQFVKDYNVKPLALELIMKSEKYKVASPIDLVCTMDIEEKGFFGEVYKTDSKATGAKKGDPKESKRIRTIFAIVDFKSTQSGFFDKHYFQLQLYKRILKENYPDLDIEGLYNWSPKDWISTPTYNLKEQSDGKLNDLCEVVFEQGRIKHTWKSPSVDIYDSQIHISSFNFSKNYKKVLLIDYLKEIHKDGERSETN